MRIDRYLTTPVAVTPTRTAHPIWAMAFRPFFLGAAALVALWLPLWVAIHAGAAHPPLALPPVDWHLHELVFGFAGAVLAGFLLTAARNWTNRPTASGALLAATFGLWVVGRIALVAGAGLPVPLTALFALVWLVPVIVALARPIMLTRNRRNYALPLLLLVFLGLGIAFHLGPEAFRRSFSAAAVSVLAVFLVFMGGRVIPFFTRNALPDARVRTPPWLAWSSTLSTFVLPIAHFAGAALWFDIAAIVAGVLALVRLMAWNPLATRRAPILWVLHLGYAWVGIGLLLMGLGGLVPGLVGSAPLHALTVGGLGLLAIGMMARVSLGHTGRKLIVGTPMVVAFVLVAIAAFTRVVLPLAAPATMMAAVAISGVLFSAAWLVFVVVHVPILTRPRADGAPG